MVFGDGPVLKFEVGHSLEVADVVCDYGRIETQSVGRDHGMENTNWVALCLKMRPEVCILCCCITVPLKNH